MKRVLFISMLISMLLTNSKTLAFTSRKKINIYYDKNMVCIERTNKCFSFAKGSNKHPTPVWEGPSYLINHITEGFYWKNPLTKVVYKPGTHNLGDIWIEFYYDVETEISYGFHQTPYPNTPLSLQQSHGCLRMSKEDIKSFSSQVNLFDEFYIIRD